MEDKKNPVIGDKLRGRQLTHIGRLSKKELHEVIALGEWFRDNRYDMTYSDLLKGRVQALLFVYESTRTRMGFEAAMAQLGGHSTYLAAKDTQMGRGETMADTARALEQYIDVFTGRLWSQDDMETAASFLSCPVLNACTPLDHSTHVIGELMCIKKAKGGFKGLNLVYTGMARGILHSLIRVCPELEINLTLAVPESYARTINREILEEAGKKAAGAGVRLEACTDVYSGGGYSYAVEKADTTAGWTKPAVDEFYNLGYEKELAYFLDCVIKDKETLWAVGGPGDMKCLEIIGAMYKSSREGRLVSL